MHFKKTALSIIFSGLVACSSVTIFSQSTKLSCLQGLHALQQDMERRRKTGRYPVYFTFCNTFLLYLFQILEYLRAIGDTDSINTPLMINCLLNHAHVSVYDIRLKWSNALS